MRAGRRLGLAGVALAVAGCGSQAATVTAPVTRVPPVALASSLVSAQGTWAIADMGGSGSEGQNFWQVFVRPTGAKTWSLVTPPGVADNGGLVAAAGPAPAGSGPAGSGPAAKPASLVIGFRPSQELTFSPLATTANAGQDWSPGILDGALASDPDALSVGPSGQGLALLANGSIETSDNVTGGPWTKLTTVAAIGASASGRSCGLSGVDAMSFGPNGSKVVAGTCGRRGVAGVFTDTNGTWQADGPVLPAGYGGAQVRVVRLSGGVALVTAGTSLFAAWNQAGRWMMSAPLAGAGQPLASGFGPDAGAWVLLGGGRAATISGPGGAWQALPKVPTGTAVLAPGTPYEALAVSGATATIWQVNAAEWTKAQVIKVPLQPHSSS